MEVLKNVKEDVNEVELDSEGNWKIPTPEKEKQQGMFEPREKTGLRGFRPGPTQNRLYSHTRWLEA